MATLESLKKELEPYQNTLVIDDGFGVSLLLDVEDGVDDYYWVYAHWKRGVYRATCVGGWSPLKGVIPEKDYARLVSYWNKNIMHKAR